ncbi:MAG: class I SAM-dependent methyltransferase [Polyangiales bacterium]
MGSDYAAQFRDVSVVAAYAARPAYPDGVFSLLGSLAVDEPRVVLELGAGTGDLTLGLAQHVAHVDAVEPSPAMLDAARRVQLPPSASVRWIASTAEELAIQETYALAVAAESLHWMDWGLVLPKLARCLSPRGVLAVVTTRVLTDVPWRDALRDIITRYSTNRAYVDYDIIEELTRRGLFEPGGSRQVTSAPITQTTAEYVESFHSRNGFSRERMTPEAAHAFDTEVTALVAAHSGDGSVVSPVRATVVWGRPLSP